MLSHLRSVLGVLIVLFIASCSGGGCDGCAGGCAGMTPLPGGFPVDQAIDNAASVRFSRPGLDFVEKELGTILAQVTEAQNGIMTFGVPEADINVEDAFVMGICPICIGFDLAAKICPGGPNPNATPPQCSASVGLADASFTLDAVTPSAIRLTATLPLKLEDTPVAADINPGPALTIHIGYGSNATCVGPDLQNVSVDPKALPVEITIPLVAETRAPRVGYTKLDIDNAALDLSAIASEDVRLCADCGLLKNVAGYNVCNEILNSNAIKDRLVEQLKNGLSEQVKSMLRAQLCTKPNPAHDPPCPFETSPDADGTYCVYNSAKSTCVPSLLGTDAHIELGSLLQSVSPSTTGGVDFGLAAFGPMNPAPGLAPDASGRTPNGITLGLAGGVLPQPFSNCVVPKEIAPPRGIPIPDELVPTAIDADETSHVGVALAGRFLEHALTSLYNGGLFCLGVSTEQFDMLKSGLLSFLVPSLKTLTFEQSDAAAAIATRPQAPPTLTIGGGTDPDHDPLLRLTIPKLALDFYVWSFDRFTRVFTYTADLTIPVSLQTSGGSNQPAGLVPVIGELKAANGAVSNADVLLLDDPNIVAGAVSGIFGTISKQLMGSGLAPIDLSSALASLGVELEIDRIGKLTKDKDDFVGVFATLKKSDADAPRSETTVTLVAKRVWTEHMQAGTYARDRLPELEVELSSTLDDSVHPVEYSWWIDGGTRSPWSRETLVTIKDDQLFFQGKHVLYVTSRVVGNTATEDPTPAALPYVIDALPPFVRLSEKGNDATIEAWDVVSAPSALAVRYRLDDGEFGDWRAATELDRIAVGGAQTLEVEVKDEEGNVRSVQQALRGRADASLAAAGSSCGCTTPGTTDTSRAGLVFGLGGIALVLLRRRRSGVLWGLMRTTSRRRARRGLVVGTVGLIAAVSQGCSCGSEEANLTGCGSDCNQACQTGLQKGQPGAYLSVAKSHDGSLWMAGYNDSLLEDADSLLWGDLVVGRYDLGKQAVDWETVDGLPSRDDGSCPAYETHGWRRGETDSGDNVGRWSSIQISALGQPMVSYYDDSYKRLKFAIHDGGWRTSVIAEAPGADIGKYGKMLLVDGKPVIAYMHVEPGNQGRTRSKISLARAKVESPHGPQDFTFEDIAVDEEGPCRATSCGSGEACVKETGSCTKIVGGCAASCSDSEACVMHEGAPACRPKTSTIETYPRALGAYISMALGPNGLGVVAYDGYRGNLIAFVERGSQSWERVVLDGEIGSRADGTAFDTGDMGIAASLAIDEAGTWHVSYVSGLDESLRYISMTNGDVEASSIVDDGGNVDGRPSADGKHVVGDDSTIRVDGDFITIYYADSSSLGLRRAVGARKTSSGTRSWERRSIQEEGAWLAFPQFVPGEDRVAVWWRRSTRATKTVEGDVTVLTP